jgi:CheY-like chemotaxis protein
MVKQILFVDDEEALAFLGQDLLSEYGYSVTCASSGEEALELFDQAVTPFDLLITDESMPGISGIELAQQIYQRAPELPVILCTGYFLSKEEDGMEKTNIREVLAKTEVCLKLPEMIEVLLTS